MHTHAGTFKRKSRSTCTDGHAQACTSMQKQAHININRFTEKNAYTRTFQHKQTCTNKQGQAQIKMHRHALTRKDKRSFISPDMHQTRLPLANHFAVLPITVQIRRKSVVEDPSILAFPICNVCQLPRLLARPTSDACWWLLSQCRHQVLRHYQAPQVMVTVS